MVAARGVFKAVASAQSAKSSPLHLDVLGIAVPSAAALDDATTEHVPARSRARDWIGVASRWRRRGLLLMGEGNYERALAVLQDAVKASRTPAAVNNLAIAALFNNKVQPGRDACLPTERKLATRMHAGGRGGGDTGRAHCQRPSPASSRHLCPPQLLTDSVQ